MNDLVIRSLELENFRNYDSLQMEFKAGTNLLYGNNAQGKTNILEAIFLSCTTKSHKGSRDKEMIRFGKEEAHIRTVLKKNGAPYRIDMHLRTSKNKGIALDGCKMKSASTFLKKLGVNLIFFSPEDLGIIKNGPFERRRFLDLELCQLDHGYLEALNRYQKAIVQRAKVLKSLQKSGVNPEEGADPRWMQLDVWDDLLLENGSEIVRGRERFVSEIAPTLSLMHEKLSGGRESLTIRYEQNTVPENYAEQLRRSRKKDFFTGQTNVGPHRDDLSFLVKKIGTEETDIRRFGSQGQQRTAALSLKLAEIELVKKMTDQTPILLLDDVLSELDANRQRDLLSAIGNIQTIITCTGLDEFVEHHFEINQLYHIEEGKILLANKKAIGVNGPNE